MKNVRDLNKEIGGRLKSVRHIFNEGSKLSAEQFGHLLGETRDNIANYESGRAGLPVRLLHELFFRGISPIWIIAGVGSVFAENDAGKQFSRRVLSRGETNIANLLKVQDQDNTKMKVLKVAAGLPKKNEK